MLTHANGDNVQSNMFKHATDNNQSGNSHKALGKKRDYGMELTM